MERTRFSVRDEIKDTADRFYRALSNRNLKTLAALWAHEPYAAVAGPSGQLHQGWDQVRGFWEYRFQHPEGRTVTSRLVNSVCHAVGDVAWLSGLERRTIKVDEHTWQEDLRVTCVLERKGATWQIVSYHASFPSEERQELAS